MKIFIPQLFLLCMLFSVAKLNAQAPTDLFISEYVEGSSQNKAIEVYNGTDNDIDLTAGNYVVQYYFNGGTTATFTANLTGTVKKDSVFIFAQSTAIFLTTNGGTVVANQTSASTSWYNGDDAIVIRKGGASGTIVDAIGQVGFDPGTEWGTGLTSTADNTLRRKAPDCSGDTDVSNIFDPSEKYDGFATNDFSGLGSHISSCSVTGPQITVSKPSLNFTTNVGSQSARQFYTVQGSSLTADITVTIPLFSNFGLSLTSGGPYSSSLTVTAEAANAGPVNIYVIFAPASEGTQSGNISHASGSLSANVAVQGNGQPLLPVTPIYTIQGSEAASPLTGTVVTTEGVVTADFQGSTQLNGYYIQDTTGDGNRSTSEGIFVFDTSFSVNAGDYISITGTVDEFFNLTEIKNVTSVTVLSSGNSLMPPVSIILPVTAITDLERFEGMRVTIPQTLTATETFNLGRFGEVSLSANGRLFNPTNSIDPNDDPASGTSSSGTSNVAAVTAQQDLNNRSRIILDDASNVQNPATVPFLNPADTTLRIGSTINNLTGILDFAFSNYRIQPVEAPLFDYAPRPAVPAVGNSNVKIASFNVLNYFNGDGLGGGFPTARGADSLVEFVRQRTKIINAISSLNADAVGLIEIENDGDGPQSAIADLVNGLNNAMGTNTYTHIADPTGANGNTGSDAIKVAIIYKPAVLTPAGLAKADTSPVHNRPPLAQTFTAISSNEKFTLIVNHFKSKSCTGAAGLNIDQLDGQGCFNDSRRQQAVALVSFATALQAASGDSDIISVGDYNAYEQEDPMDILQAFGLSTVLPGTYSYVFDGQSGSLDNALVSSSLNAQVSGADKWHINADEPTVKSYDQQFNPPYVYSADAFRSSDHDPVLVGLRLGNSSPTITITSPTVPANFTTNSTIPLTVSATDSDGTVAKVELFVNGALYGTDSTAPYNFTGANVEAGMYKVTAKATDNFGATAETDTLVVTVADCTGSGSISGEGFSNISGSAVINLTSAPAFINNNPDITASLSSFEYHGVADNYGGRVRGYICAPVTGNYRFYIAADEQATLFLSTDANPANVVPVAYTTAPTGFRQYNKFASQISAPVRLVKGAKYFIQSLHKEAGGADHLTVAWQLPNGTFEGPIPGSRLSPYSNTAARLAGRVAGARAFAAAMEKITLVRDFTVTATPNPSANYFTFSIKSNLDKAVSVKIMDAAGRLVETKLNAAANSTMQIGDKLLPGVYFVEVLQGNKVQRIKLVKQ